MAAAGCQITFVFVYSYQNHPMVQFKTHDQPKLPFRKAIKKPIPINCVQMQEAFEVQTLEGTLRGNPGDYLMMGVDGELYPCSKEIFEKTYDWVEETGKPDSEMR